VSPDFGLTPELVALVKHIEGWRSAPYLDPVGLPTIGYGHRIPSLDHPHLTQEEGDQLLMADLRSHRDAVLRLSPILADQPERRLAALTDLCFNCGSDEYARSHLRTQVNAGEWAQAGRNLRTWVWATDRKTGKRVKLDSLISRRKTTAEWLEG
jgi:lysozyme